MDVDDAPPAFPRRSSKRNREGEGEEGSVERPLMTKRVKSVSLPHRIVFGVVC